MIKKCFWKILVLILSSMSNLYGKPEVVDWKVLSDTSFNGAELFIDKDNGVFVKAGHYLWLNTNQVKIDQYGEYLSGFVKDGCVYLAFMRDKQNIDIYSVGKDLILENKAAIGDFPTYTGIEQAIYVSGDTNSFYLLGSRQQLPRNPGEFMRDVLSGGHGLYYDKPVLAEIQGHKVLKYEKVPYGGKIDESYRVTEVLTGKDAIYLFGFRIQREYRKDPTSNFLHYAQYNVKKRKLVQSQDIYEKFPYKDNNDKYRYFYWHLSANDFNDNLFVVFSWHGIRYYNPLQPDSRKINTENVNSSIYYSQNSGNTFGKAEVIGQGIFPLIRTDHLGIVHVIWADSNGNIIHKAKRDGKWDDEQIVMNGVIDTDEVWVGSRFGGVQLKNMCAEFDKDNNLNVVFTSKGQLVYAKIRLD